MIIKNNTNKPIRVGILSLLPGQTAQLPKPYEHYPVVEMLSAKKYDADHTFVTITAEKAGKASAKKNSADKATEMDKAVQGTANDSQG